MSNYDFTLDMETDNSNSLILRNIKQNSIVLEIGSAHGRMTKYLKEQLGCHVYIVEQNGEAGKKASNYALDAWIGDEVGDIEQYYWFHDIKNDSKVKFDYIIFADVLEHLNEPEKVLKFASKLLKDDGSIFISIPNIAHNAVLIDLLQDKFEYRDVGILDKTHKKFFTHNSLHNLVATCKLAVVKEMNALNAVSNTEFENSYAQLPVEISQYLQNRKMGEVYQFVWELKKTAYEISIITPVFNKYAFTKSYLEDLSKLDRSKVEIIIIDNASTDETLVKLEEWQKKLPNLKVIKNDINIGFGGANNKAYCQANGKYILFLNNDIRVKENHQNWIFEFIKYCDDNAIISPTGGKVDPNNNFQFLYETNDSNKDINYLSGWCLAAQKSVWDKLIDENNQFKGPFCERFFAYFEDTHLSFMARSKNINLKMINAPVVHFGKITSKQLNTFKLYQESRQIFMKFWSK